MLKKDTQSTPRQYKRSCEPQDNNDKRVTVENKQRSNSNKNPIRSMKPQRDSEDSEVNIFCESKRM